MKLNIFNSLIGLCVATEALSCSNDQVIDDLRPAGGNDSDMISFMVADDYTRGGSFGNRPGSSTRATVTSTDNIYTMGSAFAIYGDMSDSSKSIVLFNGDDVTYDSSNQWTYSNPRYWFANYEYSFVAIHPKTIPGLKDLKYENNRLAFSYTLPSNYSEATDILIAGHRRYYDASPSDPASVELSFGHIMTRLNFVAYVDKSSQNADVEINKITIKGIASVASYTVRPTSIQPGSTETSDFDEAFWTTPTSAITLSKTPSQKNVTSGVKDGMKTITLFPDSDPLFVIPQTVTGDMIVEIIYTLNGKEDTFEAYLNSTTIEKWDAGRSYAYSFTVKDDGSILFAAPTVEKWEDYEGGQYIIQ